MTATYTLRRLFHPRRLRRRRRQLERLLG